MDFNKKQFLKSFLFTLFFIGVIVSWLAFGDRGFIHLYRMEKERQEYMDRIKKLENANRELMNEIDRFRNDREYRAATVRKELGLLKENEVYIKVSKDKK